MGSRWLNKYSSDPCDHLIIKNKDDNINKSEALKLGGMTNEH